MRERAGTVRRFAALTAACVAVAVGLTVGIRRFVDRPPDTPGAPAELPVPPPVPPYSASRYLNTGPEATYIGTAACAACHPANHQSYRRTAHSRALADADPAAEPPDATFHHQASGRTYRVYRRGGELRHEEVVRAEDGSEVARTDLPVKYVIGSGHLARSYLVEVDGFLHESPITWYAQPKRWGLSPGYDAPHHYSFERLIRVTCLQCHTGRVEPDAVASHKMAVPERAIGCESCHGPGARHAQRHRSGRWQEGEEDLTIVHPGRLPRDRLEAVCSACHLSAPAAVLLRGRRETDFRPGMPLTDYRIDYHLDAGGEPMKVVGHVQQLRQSRCYQKSDLTCLTCHDPHAAGPPADRTELYRQKCLTCHAPQGCALPVAERRQRQPADDCTACHMPRVDTDIPHVASTHHRIMRHGPPPQAQGPTGAPVPVPDADVSHLGPVENRRNLGMAYWGLLENKYPEFVRHHAAFREQARANLEAAYAAGIRDGLAVVGLAECSWPTDPDRAGAYAEEALRAPDLPPEGRARALAVLSDYRLRQNDFPAAILLLEDLVRRRRYAEDWQLLGFAYQRDHRPEKALAALRQALAIRPTRPDVHAALAGVYGQLGEPGSARDQWQKAEWLSRHHQD